MDPWVVGERKAPAAAAENPTEQGLPPTQRWAAMSGLAVGVFMATMDTSIVNVGLPTLAQELHSDFTILQWVPLSYILVLTSLLLGAARLGDLLGRKRVYLIGLSMFTLSSALCGLSPSAGWLVGFRALQGLGAAAMQSLGVALVAEVFPLSQRGKALGIIGGVVSCGLATGPALGGLIIESLGWRYIFWVNLLPGLIAVGLVHRTLPAPQTGRSAERFDLAGAALVFACLVAYALAMTMGQRFSFLHPYCWGLMLVAAVFLVLFVKVEGSKKNPMLELDIFSDRTLVANLAMTFLVFINIGGALVLPFFLELVMGLSTGEVGLMMMVVPVTMGLVSPLSGALSDRMGSRGITLVGLVCLLAACLSLATLTPETGPWSYAGRAFLLGLGMGLFQSPNNNAVLSVLPPRRLGVGSGLLALGRTLGNATGISLLGAIFYAWALSMGSTQGQNDITSLSPAALSSGVRASFMVAAGFMLVALLLAWWARRRGKQPVAGKSPN